MWKVSHIFKWQSQRAINATFNTLKSVGKGGNQSLSVVWQIAFVNCRLLGKVSWGNLLTDKHYLSSCNKCTKQGFSRHGIPEEEVTGHDVQFNEVINFNCIAHEYGST